MASFGAAMISRLRDTGLRLERLVGACLEVREVDVEALWRCSRGAWSFVVELEEGVMVGPGMRRAAGGSEACALASAPKVIWLRSVFRGSGEDWIC